MNRRIRQTLFLILFMFITTGVLHSRPKTGLVLSGGGARGFAHIGTLKLIDSLGIPIDYIAGTSMGGIIGALYASGYSGSEIEELARSADWEELFTDRPPRASIPFLQKRDDGKFQVELGLNGFTPVIPSGLIGGQKIALLFTSLTAPIQHVQHFDSLAVPYRCIAVDLLSGQEVVLEKGSLARAMRATMAIPTVFSPVEWGDSLLVDGGILNNFPADVVREMGAEVIIGVNAGTPLKEKADLQSLISILDQTMIITDYKRQKHNENLCDLVIRPDLGNYATSDFSNREIEAIIDRGIKSAGKYRSQLTEIKNPLYTSSVRLLQEPATERTCRNSTLNTGIGKKESRFRQPLIFGISIRGNQRLPYLFIYRLLGIRPSDQLDLSLLTERINYMYGLGYFEKIEYELQPVSQQTVRLILNIKEKPLRRLRVGFRYDPEYKMIGMLGIQATNIPLPGFRAKAALEFAGLFRWQYTLSYPSRSLNLPIIPYLRLSYKDIPVEIYNQLSGEKMAAYDDRAFTWGGGLGFLLGNRGILEIGMNEERVDIDPDVTGLDPRIFPSWNDKLHKLRAHLRIDNLDNMVLPRSGILWDLRYDGSYRGLKTDVAYQQVKTQLDVYTSPFPRHTFHMQAFATGYLNDIPIYKYAMRGGPHTFVGVKYNQIEGPQFGYLRFDYRFRYKKDIFFKLIGNAGLFDSSRALKISDTELFYGYGLGLKLLSIVGPFEIILSRGSKGLYLQDTMQTRLYVSFGLLF